MKYLRYADDTILMTESEKDHPYDREREGTEEPLDESERGE